MPMPWDRHWQDEEPDPDQAWDECEQRYAEWLDRMVDEQREALMWHNEPPLIDGEV